MHYYVDMPHTDESYYHVKERHVSIDPAFHTHLQKHKENDINRFLLLPKVIPAKKRNRQQSLLDFTKSKILTSVAYKQGYKEVLA